MICVILIEKKKSNSRKSIVDIWITKMKYQADICIDAYFSVLTNY